MKKFFLLFLFIFVFTLLYFTNLSFGDSQKIDRPNECMTHEELLNLAFKISGLKFFITSEVADKKDIFEKKKKIIVNGGYPIFKDVKKGNIVKSCFLAKCIYQLITAPEKRINLSNEDLYAFLKQKGYVISNYYVNGNAIDITVERKKVLTLFSRKEFLNEVLDSVNPVESSPYSTSLSQEYSKPASPVK
jgi:hypothetical protein